MCSYNVIGMMSGTSLDGLDMLQVKLHENADGRWRYEFVKAQTFEYPQPLRTRLAAAVNMSGLELTQLHFDYGHHVGRRLREFTADTEKPDFAAVHGHTVFHQPEKGITLQIGDGAAMAAESGLTIVNNFRTTDVALGGQGAPLVPIGDELLFGEYDFCLNLGGISNISYRMPNGHRIAFDISVCNMALNHYAAPLDMTYDKDGLQARSGKPIPELFFRLEALEYYRQQPPKSLGFEWFMERFLPIVQEYESYPVQDILHTLVEHIAGRIAAVVNKKESAEPSVQRTLLLTGGGALNLYLKERIAALSGLKIAPVNKQLIDYKEALIFALLGVLRMENKPNCLKSVTGAARNNIGGAVYRA